MPRRANRDRFFLNMWTVTLRAGLGGLTMLQLNRLGAPFLSRPGDQIVLRANGMSPHDYSWFEVERAPAVMYVSRKAAPAQERDRPS